MSLVVQAQSDHRRHGKRGLDNDENQFSQHTPNSKARRVLSGSRCSPGVAFAPSYVVGPTTVAALRSLFPAMNEQTITEVLSDCGSDIDAAIKRLGQLQLRAEGGAVAAAAEHSTIRPSANGAVSPTTAGQGDCAPASPLNRATRGAAAGAAASTCSADASAQQQQQQQQQQQRAQEQLKTPEQWVDTLVQTMSQAKDIPDARVRAVQVLQTFEQAILTASQAKAVPEEAQQQLAALQRDNAILKRAVAIQNGRLQEVAGKEAELNRLRVVTKEYHDRVQALELSNYSLAQHLRAATDGRSMGPGQNRDVF